MDIISGWLKLSGPKDGVLEAETRFSDLNSRISEDERLEEVARQVVWAYQMSETTWEKYNPKLNAKIEDARRAKHPEVS
ncbi:unnamed protein product [Didymodactylos carnosus]|nr:unnamed protein product [Didymodactylos carnosus]CAF4472646.1 unnamed protein product [Didymodactylos carnosus]